MAETGVLAATLPEAAAPAGLAQLPPDPLLRLAALLTGDRGASPPAQAVGGGGGAAARAGRARRRTG